MPTETEDTDIYDIKYYSRDTRRSKVHNTISVVTHPSLQIHEGDEPTALIGSPGTFANPAVAQYDETGLRSAMAATHEEMNKSIENYMPTHLGEPEWKADEEKIVQDYVSKGLPPVPGRQCGWKIPAIARTNAW